MRCKPEIRKPVIEQRYPHTVIGENKGARGCTWQQSARDQASSVQPDPPIVRQSLGGSFRELGQTVRNRAFAVLMPAGLCAYTVQRISYATSTNLYT